MKIILSAFTLVASILLSFTSFANHGIGSENSHGKTGFHSTTGTMPPGLQKKEMPKGLQMQNKTPHGWSKGEKEGWSKQHWKKNHKNSGSTNWK